QARHIARHDPARVRREVEAKRDLLMRYERHLAEKKDLQAALDEAEQAVEHEERTGEWTKPAGWLRNLNREGERLETRGSVLRALMRAAAAVYQDHPDYGDSWRIQGPVPEMSVSAPGALTARARGTGRGCTAPARSATRTRR